MPCRCEYETDLLSARVNQVSFLESTFLHTGTNYETVSRTWPDRVGRTLQGRAYQDLYEKVCLNAYCEGAQLRRRRRPTRPSKRELLIISICYNIGSVFSLIYQNIQNAIIILLATHIGCEEGEHWSGLIHFTFFKNNYLYISDTVYP